MLPQIRVIRDGAARQDDAFASNQEPCFAGGGRALAGRYCFYTGSRKPVCAVKISCAKSHQLVAGSIIDRRGRREKWTARPYIGIVPENAASEYYLSGGSDGRYIEKAVLAFRRPSSMPMFFPGRSFVRQMRLQVDAHKYHRQRLDRLGR